MFLNANLKISANVTELYEGWCIHWTSAQVEDVQFNWKNYI